MSQTQISLGAFLMGSGHHLAAWRHPLAPAGALDFAHFRRLAQTAERGLFDAIFFADNLALLGSNELAAHTTLGEVFDPLMLLASLASVTERIGLISTVSTSYNDPYLLARRFASLDHLSGGRAGWNLVTSATDQEAQNFGLEQHFDHADRYARAEEFIDVARGLWDSFADDAFRRDKLSGRYFDPEQLRTLAHHGDYYRVRGPLNQPRSPQGHPVLVQAGSSEPGKALAARTAEVVFTAQQTLEDARAFYSDLKGRLAGYGREAHELKIMPGISPVIGRTQSEAEDLHAELQGLIEPARPALRHGRRAGPVPFPAGWSAAGAATQQCDEEQAGAVRRIGAPGKADVAPALPAGSRGTRALHAGRRPQADRRPSGSLVQRRRRRRLQHHATAVAQWPGQLRGTGGAGVAEARAVPSRIPR